MIDPFRNLSVLDLEEERQIRAQRKLITDPKYASKHWVIPIEIVYTYEILHDIDVHEFLMLARIESLIRFGSGCFANNQWFAERHGCKVRQIQYILANLKKKGYIKIKQRKGQRYITTKWTPKSMLKKRKGHKKKRI